MKYLLFLGLISNTAFAGNGASLTYGELCHKNSCTTEEILVETPTGIEHYDHITVEKNCRGEVSYIHCDYEYYLRDQKENIVKTSKYLINGIHNNLYGSAISVALEEHFIKGIYDCRSINKSSWQYIYDKKIQNEKNSICILYKMKSPFTGEIKDCGPNEENVIDTVNYSSNMITMKKAAIETCKFMNLPENKRCDIKAFGIYTNEKSTYYDILVSRDLTPSPNPYPCIKDSTGCSQRSDNDYPIFRIDALTGKISLKKILKESPKKYDAW